MKISRSTLTTATIGAILMVPACFSTINQVNAQTLDLTLSGSASQSADIRNGYEGKVSAFAGHWGLWASYGEHDHTVVTQSAGSVSLFGVGGAYKGRFNESIGYYVDVGVVQAKGDYKPRIMKEGWWFEFAQTFAEPTNCKRTTVCMGAHWLEDANYLQEGLEYTNDFDLAPVIRLGTQIDMTNRLSFDLSVRFLHLKQYRSIKDPAKAEKYGYWEGEFDVDATAFNIGFNWSF